MTKQELLDFLKTAKHGDYVDFKFNGVDLRGARISEGIGGTPLTIWFFLCHNERQIECKASSHKNDFGYVTVDIVSPHDHDKFEYIRHSPQNIKNNTNPHNMNDSNKKDWQKALDDCYRKVLRPNQNKTYGISTMLKLAQGVPLKAKSTPKYSNLSGIDKSMAVDYLMSNYDSIFVTIPKGKKNLRIMYFSQQLADETAPDTPVINFIQNLLKFKNNANG